MTLPALITIKGTVRDQNGATIAGRFVFTRSTTLFPAASDDDNYLIPGQTVADVAADGILSVPIYASNDPAASPTGWTYEVRTHFPNWKTTFTIVVPYDAAGGEINLNELAPVPEDGTGDLYALANHSHPGGGSVTYGPVTAQTTYAAASNSGANDSVSRSDHRHGTPALPTAADIGASATGHTHTGTYDPAGTASSAVSTHAAALDPHPGYLTPAEGNAAYDALGAATSAVATHEADTTNVHGITNTANLVLTGDSRLSDARTPTAHTASHGSGGSDPVAIAGSQITSGSVAIARLPTGTSGTTVAFGDAPAAAISTHVAASDPHTQYSRINYWNGSAYTVVTGAEIYVGGTGPAVPTNGDVHFP